MSDNGTAATLNPEDTRAAGACEAINKFLGPGWPCGQPPAGFYRRMCIHEHARDRWLCQYHAASTRGLCRTCRQLSGELSHECPLTWLTGGPS